MRSGTTGFLIYFVFAKLSNPAFPFKATSNKDVSKNQISLFELFADVPDWSSVVVCDLDPTFRTVIPVTSHEHEIKHAGNYKKATQNESNQHASS